MAYLVLGAAVLVSAAAGLAVHGFLMRAFDPGGRQARNRELARELTQARRAEGRDRVARNIGDAALRAMPLTREHQHRMGAALRHAGLQMSAGAFWAASLMSLGAGSLAGVAIALSLPQSGPSVRIGVVVMCVAAGLMAPRIALAVGTRRRREAIEAALPGVLELLSVVVGAGQTVERGIKTVSEKTQGPLAEEFAQVYADIAYFGNSTTEALAKMADRCDVAAVSSFSASVAQSLAAGSSIRHILRSQAKIATDNYYLKVEERSNKIRVKMIAPTILFILPPVFIITLGPAVMRMMEALPQIAAL